MRYLSEEELALASRFLFLSMAILVIQKDTEALHKSTFKIKEPFADLLGKMEHEAVSERRQLRGRMAKKQLQVVSLNKNDSFSSFLFICKGREEKRNYFNPAIRKKVENILRELIQKAQQPHQHYSSTNT
ncbi:hypothetical protein [Sediminibacillus albus]|uniref:Uncharacterized protein n=1 Tax=Sediminibacillus albus TaxID=407036 RepID=A0A1G8XC66_9BACI|nr:hypothetical protein [Sediminibacillus albus]SDJ88093.1 hypothetical protein SAMN05216243_1280 [Sediminibacillus albus]